MSTSDRFTRVKKNRTPFDQNEQKLSIPSPILNKSLAKYDPDKQKAEKKRKFLILISQIVAQITCGTLYLNMASFFPIYADGKFNHGILKPSAADVDELVVDDGSEDVVSTLEISFCIVSFELACILSGPIHAKTISLMGRKNAILIGFLIQLICCVLLGAAAYIPVEYPAFFLWFVIIVRMLQGYGDSLSLTCSYSVINLTFTEDRAEKIGMMEAAFGFGCIVGPSLGSVVYGAVGYEMTMYFFGAQTLLFMVLQAWILPNSLNQADEDEDPLTALHGPSEEERKLLEGYNLLKFDTIGLMTVLCDPMCAFAYFGTFFGMFAMEFWVGFLSLHLEKQFLFQAEDMGYMFSINPLTYLPACILMPYVFKTSPPRLITFASFLPMVIGIMLMGPSQLIGLPNNWEIIAVGLGLLGLAIAPSFVLCLPEVHNRLQCKYKIVEKTSESLDGKLSDQEAALYAQFYAAAAFVAPMCGSALYDVESLGYRGALDLFMFAYAIFGVIFGLGYCGFTPYADYKAQLEQLAELAEVSKKLEAARSKQVNDDEDKPFEDAINTTAGNAVE